MFRFLAGAVMTMTTATRLLACESVLPDHVRILDCPLAGAVVNAANCLPASPARARSSPVLHLFLNGKARMTVNDSINGAVRRLARPACQQLFTDFTDSDGRSLTETLTTWGKSPADALAGLYFVDADNSAQCRDRSTAAYTQPGSRVIFVCGARFAELFARKTEGGEIVLIHELLHALGLGENPPTSAHITEAVYARCGR